MSTNENETTEQDEGIESEDEFMNEPGGWRWKLGAYIALCAAIPLWSWVFAVLWAWFVVPLGFCPIGMAHAFGLSSVASMLLYWIPKIDDEEETRLQNVIRVVRAWLTPIVALGFGFAAHLLM